MSRIAHLAGALILLDFFCFCVSETARSQAPPLQASTTEALQLLHKMQTALGGADKIAAIRDYEETVRAQTWNNKGVALGQVRKRTRWMRSPNLLRLDQIGPRDTYVLYFDGRSGMGWEILPDVKGPDEFKTVGKAIELAGGELEFAKGYLSGFQLNTWLADRTPGYAVTSPGPNVLRIEHSGSAEDFTLDPITALPIKSAGISLAGPDQPVRAEMHYGGWVEVDGVRFPTRRTSYYSGVKMAEQTTEGAIRLNAGLTQQKLAAKPADFAPDMPSR